jgi:hypothetical protein
VHTVEVRYTPQIVRSGIRRFWWRFAGRDAVVGAVGVAALLGLCAFLVLLCARIEANGGTIA